MPKRGHPSHAANVVFASARGVNTTAIVRAEYVSPHPAPVAVARPNSFKAHLDSRLIGKEGDLVKIRKVETVDSRECSRARGMKCQIDIFRHCITETLDGRAKARADDRGIKKQMDRRRRCNVYFLSLCTTWK